ncbi:MAG TPA: hypothetical protein VK715_03390 [Steroidobacteraceae bacterium]|jgi:hypothetical protein|nr:hypothetical protein [Steroidobacteraceae bacterium]
MSAPRRREELSAAARVAGFGMPQEDAGGADSLADFKQLFMKSRRASPGVNF